MPSRRSFLRRAGTVAGLGVVAATADRLGDGVVRTKAGGTSDESIDLESPDSETFVPPADVAAYVSRTRERYGDAGVPWTDPGSLAGEFVGAYARREDVVPSERYAVQDAAVLVHHLGDARYRLRLWSAGRLLDEAYEVDPWGYYREDPAFTWLEHAVATDRDEQLSANRSLSTGGGRVDVAGGSVSVPDGSYRTGLDGDARYRSRWEGFHAGAVPLLGACEVRFGDGDDHRLDWTRSTGVGVRTPF
ncbi:MULTISPECIES: hypothetical protein [Halorussus]|uniref:hypothetical protein n=1 Tax=Halorussus TaxID=1070314 RepID=UPI00209D5DB1|nr:hypothetical protein [Halorussus vallis]USZ78195.1 hypothetical protein NGM07_21295 [Halorussus vallis]